MMNDRPLDRRGFLKGTALAKMTVAAGAGCSSSSTPDVADDPGSAPSTSPEPTSATSAGTSPVVVATTTDDPAAVPGASPVSIDRSKKLQSLYVPMRDDVRLAIDVWLPETAAEASVPMLIRATRYQRAIDTQSSDPAMNSNAEEAQQWLDRGYGLVIVDARGSGASFGSRNSELSLAEVEDYGEIIEWVGTQPWSNGRVGSYGVSYDGDTAEHMARFAGEHLVAIAPQFSDFDPWRQTIFPGGTYFSVFDQWLGLTQALDEVPGAVDRLAESYGVSVEDLRTELPGVAPVDGPDGRQLLTEAIADHAQNAVLDLGAIDYRDDPKWDESAIPTYQADIEASNVAVFVQAGWLDAATVVGTLERFSNFDLSQEVWIGPWPHGGGSVVDSAVSADAQPSFDDLDPGAQFDRLTAFFDTYVRDGQSPTGQKSLRYTTLNADGWTETPQWPILGVTDETFHVAGDSLTRDTPTAVERFDLPTTPHTSGQGARWVGQIGGEVGYGDWPAGDTNRRSFTSEPLSEDLTVTGFPVVSVVVESTDVDGTLFAYLEIVDADGVARPVSEGSLRLSRRGATQPAVITSAKLERSFAQADNAPMEVGEPTTITFEFVPISVRFNKGSRLQLSFASTDVDNFRPYAQPGASLTIVNEPARPTMLVLPIATST
jgi:uncharacterized protein